MTNKEIANRIIENFLKVNPQKSPGDFIIQEYSLNRITCFNWDTTPEGYDFWYSFYTEDMQGDDDLVRSFLKTYYFIQSSNTFINLKFVL